MFRFGSAGPGDEAGSIGESEFENIPGDTVGLAEERSERSLFVPVINQVFYGLIVDLSRRFLPEALLRGPDAEVSPGSEQHGRDVLCRCVAELKVALV